MKSTVRYIDPGSCNSLSDLFLKRVSQSPGRVAYIYFDPQTGGWFKLTWQDMLLKVNNWRNSLAKEGLKAGDRVAVVLPNSPEWVAFEQASLSLGLIVVPLYANDRPENLNYILQETETKLLFCPGTSFCQLVAHSFQPISYLTKIVTIDSCILEGDDKRVEYVGTWLSEREENSAPYTPSVSETATIVYTSGTTGPPKGVMLSHSNILENSSAGLQTMNIYPSDSFLSFLPLSHMLERTAGYYMPMMSGASVAFARSIPDLAEDLVTLQPTVLVAVPRIFEKMYAGIRSKVESGSPGTKKLFNRAVEVGWKSFLYKQGRGNWSFSYLSQPILDLLVGKKVRNKLGGKLRVIISGGAALSTEISQFFIGLGLPISQGYGLTETSPVVSVNRQEDNRPEGVGRPLPGVGVKIGEDGELLVKGALIMQGYWQNEKATAETIDDQGWLHTGDKAEIIDGHIRITGRLKEILVLSNGEKVSPTDMEMAISLDPLFEHNIVVGEGKPYMTLLCVLNMPLWEQLAESLGVSNEESSLALDGVRKELLGRIEKLLAPFPGFIFIKDVSASLTPWTVEMGLLTPTLKMKRKAIEKHLSPDISHMYKQH